jgi:hypothetical protein
MADTGADRTRRYRQHRAGNHTLCKPGNCRVARPSVRIAEVPPDAAEVLDPVVALRDLAQQLLAAYRQDPGNALPAREVRATLLALSPRAEDGAQGELAVLSKYLATPGA